MTATFPPPSFPGGTVSLRFEALPKEGVFSRVVASVGLSWRFGTFADQRTSAIRPKVENPVFMRVS